LDPRVSPFDVIVVGAGPSGALAAHELARGGASVLLLDRAAFPRWKVCGACLSPGALRVLDAAGLGGIATELGGVGLRSLVLAAQGRSARVRLAGSLALSRSALDTALVRAAEAAGAVFWPGSRVSLGVLEGGARRLRVARDGAEVLVAARIVVDATGLGRGLRDETAPSDDVAARSRVGVGAVVRGDAYPVVPGNLHMAVGRAGYVGLVRVEDGALNVAAALDPGPLRTAGPEAVVSSVLAEAGLPALGESPLAGWRGTPLLTRSSPDAGNERLFRVGDAAGYVEPFTGEGICWALSAGRVVARLAEVGAERWRDELLDAWRAYRRHALAPSQRLCRALSGALRRPRLVSAAVAALRVAPALAAPFVSRAGRPPMGIAAMRGSAARVASAPRDRVQART
jgi:flavin-dependent dehydrogenase